MSKRNYPNNTAAGAVKSYERIELELAHERRMAKWREIEASWFKSYCPTIRIECRDGAPFTPSCETVEDAIALRQVCMSTGRGYYDGRETIGRAC